MPEQKHIIKKQILNIHLSKNLDAQPIQQEILNIYNTKLVPIINQVCNQLSPVGTKHKIDQLNIDLGKLPIADFENDFVQLFTSELQSQLRHEVNSATTEIPKGKKEGSPIDLFTYYIKTGVLPWWAEETTKAYLHKVLDTLNDHPDDVFKKVVLQLCQNKIYLERFVYTFSDEQICRTIQNLTTFPIENLIPILNQIQENVSVEAANYWWINVARQINDARNYEELEQNVVLETLRNLNTNPNHILKTISNKERELFEIVNKLSTQNRPPVKSAEISAIEQRLNEMARKHSDNKIVLAFVHMVEQFVFHPMSPDVPQVGPAFSKLAQRQIIAFVKELKVLDIPDEVSILKVVKHAEIQKLEKQTRESLKNIIQTIEGLQKQITQLKDSVDRQLDTKQTSLEELVKIPRSVTRKSKELIAIEKRLTQLSELHAYNPYIKEFVRIVEQLYNQPAFKMVDGKQIKTFVKELKSLELPDDVGGLKSVQPSIKKQLKTLTRESLKHISITIERLKKQTGYKEDSTNQNTLAQLHSTYDESESISINNAGLVLFWPFLQPFFQNMELIQGKDFISKRAQDKAAIVLQYLLVEDQLDIFEALLPLNKVLCGIELTYPIESVALDADEKEVINGLLKSVISKGPMWQNLSLEGFRKSYLQREGLLRTRDGKWLLQVKKETYDVTLEKLPWSFTTIKLPWMTEMLVVEWL